MRNQEERKRRVREYTRKNRLVKRARDRAYYRSHSEQIRSHVKEYRRVHTEEHRQYSREYAKNHRQQRRVSERNRRALRRNRGTHTIQDVINQYARQRGHCYYCRCKVAWGKHHVDHIIPLIRGGMNTADNLVITCPTCNLRKREKRPHEWLDGGRLL
jgi:5-methylcytosine-specific restriction endonuclease McrA